MSNVINFPTVKHKWDESQSIPDIDAPKAVRRSYAERMAHELFDKTMRTIEGTGALDVLLEADDIGFDEIQPRLLLVKEALLSVFMFLEGEQHELDNIVEKMFNIVGIDEESLELVATYNDKYLQKLHAATENFNNDVNND